MAINFGDSTVQSTKAIASEIVTNTMTGSASTSSANVWTQITALNTNITVSSSTSKVLVIIHIGQASTTTGASIGWAATRGGSRIFVGNAAGSRPQSSLQFVYESSAHSNGSEICFLDTPGSSGTHTYGLQFRAQGGCTAYLNRTQNNNDGSDTYLGRAISAVTLLELNP